ncbi:Sec-independent protein translocase protein TatB [Luteimonas sp. 9C]|uniref:Sec-independent protein translocase protein TatB n=1 Tax=Luteimonas sp. 9C TaxID=2653148 RepID=UPI0012F1CD8E|nr:Sec-independent protein translocase protein TatB [Luteimonas sp. 9C]VXB16134.1 Sec-independent protein translocase protein TatB [Luteimonas sp. 9C]
MFGIGTAELMIIALIALIVLGPERLPKAARFAGLWVRRARAQWYSVKSELERELAAEELKRSMQDAQRSIADVGTQLRDAEQHARSSFDDVRKEAGDLVAQARRMSSEPPATHRSLDAAPAPAPTPVTPDAPPLPPDAIAGDPTRPCRRGDRSWRCTLTETAAKAA